MKIHSQIWLHSTLYKWYFELRVNVFPQQWMLKALVTEQIIKFDVL